MDSIPTVEVPDEKDQRFSVLSYEQVKRLSDLMSENISIQGRGNFPTIEVKLCDLVSVVKQKLEEDGVHVKEIRLNGSGASSVLSSNKICYNDLDLIFSVDLSSAKAYDRVKTAVLESLMYMLPEGVSRKRMSSCSMKEAYVSKMVKVSISDSDHWSLITLGNNRTKSVELKFVDSMRRQYEFSVDSFHILLDTLFLFYDCAESMPISDNFYPTVVGESMYGDYEEAIYHLHKKLIATRNPEEIRGGGLLKYCNLLCQGYLPAHHEEVKNMERYMCSRFFIDFPELHQQQTKLEGYLITHFHSHKDRQKYDYLMYLYQVVDESTVCLMGHERRLTLSMIEDLACQIYCPQQHTDTNTIYYPTTILTRPSLHLQLPHSSMSQTAPSSLPSSEQSDTNGSFILTATDSATAGCCSSVKNSSCNSGSTTPNEGSTIEDCLHSPMSVSSNASSLFSSNSSSASSSGYTTPQKPETPGILPQAISPGPHPLSSTPTSHIPTYEIVTSCQPAVVYSNGYYYTSFPPNSSSNNSGSSNAYPECTTCKHWMSQQPPFSIVAQKHGCEIRQQACS